MMWRWMVLALVIANGVFWLWSHGQLRELGWGPVDVSEPARLKTQIQPEAVQVTPQGSNPAPTAEPGSAPTTAPASAPASGSEAPGTSASALPAPTTPAASAAALAPAGTTPTATPSVPTKGK